MLDEFACQIMRTLLSEMQAVDENGNIDHKTRMAALKEARSFVVSILPRLTQKDKETFSHAMSKEMESKLSHLIEEEKRLRELPSTIKKDES